MVSLMRTVILLLVLGQVCGQPGQDTVNARTMPQWLTGVIAVAVFLFLVLAVYVVNRVWNKRPRNNLQTDITMTPKDSEETISNGDYSQYIIHNIKSSEYEHEHTYENPTEVTDNVLSTAM